MFLVKKHNENYYCYTRKNFGVTMHPQRCARTEVMFVVHENRAHESVILGLHLDNDRARRE